ITAESVIARERVGGDVMDVDPCAALDVLAGEADDLAILGDSLAFLDCSQGDFVAQSDTLRECEVVTVDLKSGARWQRTSRDGDIILRPQVDGDLGKCEGRHEQILHEAGWDGSCHDIAPGADCKGWT